MNSRRHGKEMSGDTDEYETWLCGIIITYVLYTIVTFSSVSDNWFSFWCLVDLYCLYVYRHIKTVIFILLSHPQHLLIMYLALTDPKDGSWMLTGWMLFINLYIFFTSTLAPCTRYLLPRNINKTNPNMADTYAYQDFVNFVMKDMIGHYIENCSISNCYICNHTHSE